ncbi:sensor domain-containing protein [soil metagenome]
MCLLGSTFRNHKGSPVTWRAIGALALVLILAGCSDNAPASAPEKLVEASALEGMLLSPKDIDQVMGTSGMTPHEIVTQMGDHRQLLPNLNCLGVWQVDEVGVYGPSGWSALRQVMMRSPDNERWDNLVVQSVVTYHSVEDAKKFFTESADRWSKCTNHHVNITLNGTPLPKWLSGDLTKTDTRLTIPVTRGSGDQIRACQRVLALAVNVIVDVQACAPAGTTVTQAGVVADRIESALPK